MSRTSEIADLPSVGLTHPAFVSPMPAGLKHAG